MTAIEIPQAYRQSHIYFATDANLVTHGGEKL